jgi:hypothetical protein
MCATCVQKPSRVIRGFGPLELELQTVVSAIWVLRTKLQRCARAVSALNRGLGGGTLLEMGQRRNGMRNCQRVDQEGE